MVEGAALPAALATPPGPCVGPSGPRVLDWGAWAGFYSRAIADHVARADTHLRRVLGDIGGPDAYQKKMDREWSALPLYSVASTHRTRKREMNLDRIAEAITVAIERPELMTAHNWVRLQEAAPYEPSPPRSAARESLVRAVGGARNRLRRAASPGASAGSARPRVGRGAVGARSSRLHDRDAPRARARGRSPVRRRSREQALGPRAGFDERATQALTEATENGSPAQKGALLARQCAQATVHCLELGHHLVDVGREDEAAAAFEKAFADASIDRVQLSHHSRWLIRYHFRRDNRERALALAESAAATGSATGLSFHGELMELMEQYGPAEASYRQGAERYDDPSGLIAFYYRVARGKGRKEFEPRLERAARALFPKGLEPVAEPQSLGADAPRDGAHVMGHSRTLLEAGLRAGDVIVGLDGWRIHSAAQYGTARRSAATTR